MTTEEICKKCINMSINGDFDCTGCPHLNTSDPIQDYEDDLFAEEIAECQELGMSFRESIETMDFNDACGDKQYLYGV